jgi:tagatose-6-phosphate ketose/aldose isomerase
MTPIDPSPAELAARRAAHTSREIAQQPLLWHRVCELVAGQRDALDAFLGPLLQTPGLRIVLTGAGSSSFVGSLLAPELMRHLGRRVEAIPTTDLVSGPRLYFERDTPTLLVSFARSGSSPESVAAVELADQTTLQCHHLVITCNRDGELYRRLQGHARGHVLLLPDEANDRAFAMTSSFTGMLLAAALAFGLMDRRITTTARIATATEAFMRQAGALLQRLDAEPIERVAYLGSNALKGLASEAALKLLELTDGAVAAFADSPLGFRHGPKTLVNKRTLVVVFLANDPYTRRYDLDLLGELRSEGHAGHVLALSARQPDLQTSAEALHVELPPQTSDLELAFPYLAFAQLLALRQSLKLGLTPDNPSASGAVTRVVHGVTIHPYSTS